MNGHTHSDDQDYVHQEEVDEDDEAEEHEEGDHSPKRLGKHGIAKCFYCHQDFEKRTANHKVCSHGDCQEKQNGDRLERERERAQLASQDRKVREASKKIAAKRKQPPPGQSRGRLINAEPVAPPALVDLPPPVLPVDSGRAATTVRETARLANRTHHRFPSP